MSKIRNLILLSISVLMTNLSISQNITLNAFLDTNHILIGDQINLNFEITCPENAKIVFPFFKDTIIKEVEVVSQSKIDTSLANGLMTLKQKILLTSFDSGVHTIPALYFKLNIDTLTDTISSYPLYLNVYTVPIDTTQQAIMDIKQPYDAPITFKEILPYIIYSLLAILIIFAVYYVIKKLKKNEPILKVISKPKEPAHVIAIRELDKLKESKLWQQNKTKAYHSELSEIVRKYIENRFNVMALEQTTEEILLAFKKYSFVEHSTYENLYQILQLADLVKFAKVNPLPDENDISIKNAYLFVHETKLEVKPEEQNQITEQEKINENVE
ncbi:MAG TPA: hypothetical protein DDX39_06315 [Bacteroidales bacterium]|nr:MAG: hypothetical protein A2W98_00510 [Bacteroidetes bacterium GWF2_33_38]OFY72335.1 MAG: hypothetical protein A2265_07360 [Bacteroidetes bacterium RIFOXYA12_FULL_33_9]OFY90219.1 MAG: hypothetical protein A2236_02735 [Bacteroidetes bacterium RIFOXYA2_FULL_33_7]HBF88239.1 hypothetical protein [Bacteroidales bacterium]